MYANLILGINITLGLIKMEKSNTSCSHCGTQLNSNDTYCRKCGLKRADASSTAVIGERSDRSATVALFLCMFLGFLGIHRFYVGKIITGILMILTLGGFGFWTLRDLIYIASGHFEDDNGYELEFKKTKTSPAKLVTIIFSLIIIPMVAYFVFIFSIVIYATHAPVEVVENQLMALKSGDIEKAYSYGSSGFKKVTSLEDFKKFVDMVTPLKNNDGIDFSQRQINDGKGLLKGKIHSKTGDSIFIEYQMIKEGDSWKILSIHASKPKSEAQSKSD